jgi:hypothetical protein
MTVVSISSDYQIQISLRPLKPQLNLNCGNRRDTVTLRIHDDYLWNEIYIKIIFTVYLEFTENANVQEYSGNRICLLSIQSVTGKGQNFSFHSGRFRLDGWSYS